MLFDIIFLISCINQKLGLLNQHQEWVCQSNFLLLGPRLVTVLCNYVNFVSTCFIYHYFCVFFIILNIIRSLTEKLSLRLASVISIQICAKTQSDYKLPTENIRVDRFTFHMFKLQFYIPFSICIFDLNLCYCLLIYCVYCNNMDIFDDFNWREALFVYTTGKRITLKLKFIEFGNISSALFALSFEYIHITFKH